MAATVNKRELARVFGTSEPTVTRWIEQGCPVERGGSNGVAYEFDVKKVKAWREGVLRQQDEDVAKERASLAQLQLELTGGTSAIDAATQKLSPSQQREMLNAELLAVRLSRERGELIPREVVHNDYAAVFGLLRQRLLSLGPLLGKTLGLDGDQVRRVGEEARILLRDLARQVADPAMRPTQRDKDSGDGGQGQQAA